MNLELNLYSKYRTELMGVAAVMVIASHLYGFGVELCEPIKRLLGVGASGVELFLFASGFGLWKSYHEATRGTYTLSTNVLYPWYKKRFLRILIPYLIFAFPVYGMLSVMDHVSIGEYLKRVSFVSFWTEGWGLWYVAMLFPLYLVTPFVIRLLSGKRRWVWLIAFIMMAELYAYFAFGGIQDVYYSRFIVSRIPVFFISIFMGKAICEGRKISLWLVLVTPLMLYSILYGLNHIIGTRFFYLWLLPLPFATIIVWLLSHCNWLRTIFRFMGQISLEAYCTHAFVPMCIVRAFNLTPSLTMYVLGVGVSIILSMGINRLSQKTTDIINVK